MKRRPLPTGTVTFLFTDIEGSTALWERDDAAMRSALAKHDRAIKKAVESFGGTVFKQVGDASYCAFGRAEDAAAAAAAAQAALIRAKWPKSLQSVPVRMAVHAGTAQLRSGDYFGPTLNRIARLLGLARGGQILVSEAAAILLKDRLPTDCALLDVGSHLLRDLTSRERAFQLLAPGLRSEFPPIATADMAPNNLPSQLSSFVGRSKELQRIRALCSEHRLVTIVGPGGIGKTRLAIACSRGLQTNFPDGIFFVSFAPLQAGSGIGAVAAAAASSLGVREAPGEALVDALAREVGDRALLLVADNLEHILPSAALLIKMLGARCASAHILATSREPLHLRGEAAERLGALDLDDALQLFRSRAPDSGTDADENAMLGDICRRLDGNPLAIELAAARSGSLNLSTLRERLDEPFPLLVSKDPTEEQRHRTLSNTIDWSFRLLNAEEQVAFESLSVFRGGFSADAARAVAGSLGLIESNVEGIIDSLVDRSFVNVVVRGTRFSLLDTMRMFARQQARDSARFDAAQHAHFTFFAARAGALRLNICDKQSWLAALRDDLHNTEAALDWALGQALESTAVFAADLATFWIHVGMFTLGSYWIERISAADLPRTPGLGLFLRRASTLATISGDFAKASSLANMAVSVCADIGDVPGESEARFNLGVIAQRDGLLEEAETLYASCLAAFRASAFTRGVLTALNNLAQVAMKRGDLVLARSRLRESAMLAEELGDDDIAASIKKTQATIELDFGDVTTAEMHIQDALTTKLRLQNEPDIVDALLVLCDVRVRQRRFSEAAVAAQDALRRAHDLVAPALVALAQERIDNLAVTSPLPTEVRNSGGDDGALEASSPSIG